jgi:Ala-tRNA(Pro) deacylase
MLAKVVIVKAGDSLKMLVLPADRRVDLERVKRMLGKDARLATEPEFRDAFPGCEVGAMPPFGNLYDLPLYVDQALGRNERIVFQAGSHTVTMSVSYADFERLARPIVADIAVTR